MDNPRHAPCPTYDRLGVKYQSQFVAMYFPKTGIANITGKKYAEICYIT